MTQPPSGRQPGDTPSGPAFRQEITAEPGGTVYAVLDGDMHIRNGHPVYRFEMFPMAMSSAGATLAYKELATLVSWRDDPTPGVSVLLIHGPGGWGKTRGAAHFAIGSGELGWTVWAAHHLSSPALRTGIAPGDSDEALLVIVEDAERWLADDLQLLLQNPLLRRPRRARALLIACSAGAWWPALRHRLSKAGITVGGTVALPSAAHTPAER